MFVYFSMSSHMFSAYVQYVFIFMVGHFSV